MSTEQRVNLDAILRQSAFPAGGNVNEQRRYLRDLLSSQPLPADVTVTAAALGGVPTAEITVDGIEPRHIILYFHGGVYVMGDAFLAADLAAQVGRRTRAKVISVDYRLAPEHPYPAAVDDALAAYEALLHNGTAPSDIAFAGESAGGGLAIATLVNARDHGLPLPAAAFVMSPYADLTLAGMTMETKREADPLLSPQALHARVTDYTSGQDAALGLISPIFAELSDLPPLIIQAGTHEVLLDDAIRLARQAATADVEVTLDITPGVPHVFQAYYRILDEAGAALDRAGQLLSAHLAGAGRVAHSERGDRLMKAVRFEDYGGIEVLEVRDVARPEPGPDQVLVAVRAAGLNPSEAAIRAGVVREIFPATFPSGEGSDLAGVVEEVGAGVKGVAVGDEVIGYTDNRASHAEYVLVEAANLTAKPAEVPWEVAGALFVAGVTGVATVRAVAPTAGEAVVIALASERHHAWLRERGAVPVAYGDGVSKRITAAAEETPVAAFIDLVGGGYVELALELGIARDRIDTIVGFPSIAKYGVKGDGGAAAASAATLAELADAIAAGDLVVPIQRTYPLDDVRAAFTELEAGHMAGKIVLIL